jgi:predicted  nucleic acid-binding Zn-ribbon protein
LKTKLQNLFALQQIDIHLDELEELKGELPGEVRSLEEELAGLHGKVAALEQEMRKAFAARDEADNDIITFRQKLEKYKSQQLLVKTNREYDALTREMDTATETIARREKEMEVLEGKGTLARTDIEGLKAQVAELMVRLGEKKDALAEISKSTEEEELRYRDKRQRLASKVSRQDLAAYERIRKAKKGQAVVRIKRNACGGCYARVTPQKLLELRQNERMFTCEHCGRILVSDEVAETAATML